MSRVVISVPFEGPTGGVGRASAEAARAALAGAGSSVELVVLDAGAGPFGEHVASNARRAAADDEAVGYLGDFHSAATEVSLPILEAAGVPHVSFSNTLRKLVGRSFVSVVPNDERQVAGLAAWMDELGVTRPFLLDDGEEYGIDMRWLMHRELAARGMRVAGGERLFGRTEPPEEVAGADAVFLGTFAQPAAAETLRNIRALAPDALLFGTDGLLTDPLAAEAPEGLHVGSPPAPLGRESTDVWADYAREATALLLDALAAVGPDREALIAHLRATRDRSSPFGPYGFDERGASTLSRIGRFVTKDGHFVPA
jgi:ABC-type branched-subunit amino acid transport system substrate-binding protein